MFRTPIPLVFAVPQNVHANSRHREVKTSQDTGGLHLMVLSRKVLPNHSLHLTTDETHQNLPMPSANPTTCRVWLTAIPQPNIQPHQMPPTPTWLRNLPNPAPPYSLLL